MSNRTIRRAAERRARKAAEREQKQQAQPQTMAAANMPVPSLAKVLAAIRSGRIEVKAA
jgi:hypothetical protein